MIDQPSWFDAEPRGLGVRVRDCATVRLLVVEDDRALAAIVRRGLVEDGYAVDVAMTIADADAELGVNDYDLILLDLGLPDGNGLHLCRRLRENGDPARVLVLTARDSVAEKVAGLDAGADDYLTKPFAFPELSARVRALLRRPEQTLAPVLEVGELRLDPADHRVWLAGVDIPLQPREFAVLAHLMAHPYRVVTRTELIDHVWDGDYDGMSNVVDVQIAALRRKLARPNEPLPLETVRGVGYRLTALEPPP